MSSRRHAKILEIVSTREISTQGELLLALRDSGFDVTQATVSRDIHKLRLTKQKGPSGRRRYVAEQRAHGEEALMRIFKESVTSLDRSMNLIVLKTIGGVAAAAAEAIDQLSFPGVLGTVAGDNTIFVACTSQEAAEETAARFSVLLHT